MKFNLLLLLSLFSIITLMSCSTKSELNKKESIIRVPADIQSIAKAVAHSKNGDTIVIAPGSYNESEITIDKRIVVTSEWKLDGDTSKIEKTVIDAGDKILSLSKSIALK
jgi:hypothetical protein